jgi:hypothetical protein
MNNPQITIVTNTFGKYKRQNIAIESLLHLKKTFPFINIYNFQFKDEEKTFQDSYEGIDTLFDLDSSSLTYMKDAKKKLPVFSEMIFKGFNYGDPDYVIYVNSDVILLPRLIELILKESPDCLTGPRLDIEDNLQSFQDVLDDKVTPQRVEIAGYDFFVFKKEWFNENKKYLHSKFLIGKPFFDVVYAGLMVIFGKKYMIYNDFPMLALHMAHGNASVTESCVEREHNENVHTSNPIFNLAGNIMHYNLQHNLCKRKPWGVFIKPQDNEQDIQHTFFDVMNIHSDNQIKYIE